MDGLISQLMCVNISASLTPEQFEEHCKERKPGCIFVMRKTVREVKTFLEIATVALCELHRTILIFLAHIYLPAPQRGYDLLW